MYEVIRINGVVESIKRLSDGAEIPLNPKNSDFAECLEWQKKTGIVLDTRNMPAPSLPKPTEPLSSEEIQALRDLLKQRALDSKVTPA